MVYDWMYENSNPLYEHRLLWVVSIDRLVIVKQGTQSIVDCKRTRQVRTK